MILGAPKLKQKMSKFPILTETFAITNGYTPVFDGV